MIAMGHPRRVAGESQDVEGLDLARQHGPFKIPDRPYDAGDVVEVRSLALRPCGTRSSPMRRPTIGSAASRGGPAMLTIWGRATSTNVKGLVGML